MRKSKADPKLKLARDMKGNRKGFYKRNSERDHGKYGPTAEQGKGSGDKSHIKVKVLNSAITSVSADKAGLQES